MAMFEGMQRETRREYHNITGKSRGGKLRPVAIVQVNGHENGTISQKITVELDKVAGRLLSSVTFRVTTVAVPYAAMSALAYPSDENAGMQEILKNQLLKGVAMFSASDPETPISMASGINPTSTGGVKRVSTVNRLGHNAAVNFLRKRLYTYATEVPGTNTAITPALISETAMQKYSGVLDPDERINGQVNLQFASMNLPVVGVGFEANPVVGNFSVKTRTESSTAVNRQVAVNDSAGARRLAVETVGTDAASYRPNVYAQLNAATAGNVSLIDFYNAQTQDRIVREAREIASGNPVEGEEAVLYWAYGLSVDSQKYPYVIYETEGTFDQMRAMASDGQGLMDEVSVTGNTVSIKYTVPVGASELGMAVVTFLEVKPDENLVSVPHPFLSRAWLLENRLEAEMALDPVPVTMRQLYSDVPSGSEATVAFYTGLNETKRNYVNYGFARDTDLTTVENKNALWQLALPASVTPDNVIYPEDISHYPFVDQNAKVVLYNAETVVNLMTPIQFGPTPVETVEILSDEALLG